MKKISNTSTRTARSFRCAFSGAWTMLRSQRNTKIHLAATLAVIGLGIWSGLGSIEWALLAVVTTLVWVAEGINTALETLADRVQPEYDPLIGRAKDVSAGAVLLAAIGAAIVGLLVFLPRLI